MRSPVLAELPATGGTGWPWDQETPIDVVPGLPVVSIVMPSLNQAEYLEAAIRSVLLQGYRNCELVVVDGGSTDGSLDILRAYDRWIRWTSEPDRGQYDAITKGFRGCAGDVMGWLNSSDMLAPGGLQAVGDGFRDLNVRWLTSGMPGVWNDAGDLTFPLGERNRWRRSWIEKGWYEGRVLGWIQQESTYWSAALWGQVDGLHSGLDYAADFELWRRFSRVAPLHVVDRPIAGFRHHPAQKTADLGRYYDEIDLLRPSAPGWVRPHGGRAGYWQRRALSRLASSG